MSKIHIIYILLLFLIICSSSSVSSETFDVVKFGAVSDGSTDFAKPLAKAWHMACDSSSPSTIHIPEGRFLLTKIVFNGPCNSFVKFQIHGVVVASSGTEGGVGKSNHHENWIRFHRVTGVSMDGNGTGTFDGQGHRFWSSKGKSHSDAKGVSSLTFQNSRNISINGIKSLNSKLYHIVINQCKHVSLRGVNISAPGNSPNTDGVHVQRSDAVTVTDTTIATGDDCVSIGPGTTNLWIERVSCGPGHGISIGSLGKKRMEKGVQNVTVKYVTFKNSTNGLRIKSWGRPSSGFVKGVVFQHVTMIHVHNPIVIDQNYCPHSENCPNKYSGIKISEVYYDDIHGTSATEVAVNLACSPSNPCDDIHMQNVKLHYQNEKAKAQCSNAKGTTHGLAPSSCL